MKLNNHIRDLEKYEKQRIKKIHEHKLSRLLGAVCDHTQSSLLDTNKLVYNLSSKELTPAQTTLLSRGWKFCIEQRIINPLNLQTEIEHNMGWIKKQANEENTNWEALKVNIRGAAQDCIKKATKKIISNLNEEEHQALKQLKEDKSVVLLKADKGNAIVIMDKNDYYKKVKELLTDHTKFTPVKEDETDDDEVLMNRRLTQLKKNKKISTQEYNALFTSGSSIPVLYCTVKTHKENFPLRPIVSMCNASNYKLASYLANMLKKCEEKNTSNIKDSFQFVKSLKYIKIANDETMISFDIQSLYPNVPVEEAIDIAVKLIWEKNKAIKFTKITKHELYILFNLAVRNVHFRFFNQYFRQIDGIAMGSPLAPVLANLFVTQLEEEKINRITKNKVRIWFRYVDDIFAIVKGKDIEIHEILEGINKIHKNIKFTIEFEQDNSITFLNVNIKRKGSRLETSVHRKKTNTNLYLKWDACLPRYQKLGLITSLVTRACRICSLKEILNQEIEHIKKILTHNGYPRYIVNKKIKNAICKEKHKERGQQANNTLTTTSTAEANNKKKVISFSYTGNESSIFNRK